MLLVEKIFLTAKIRLKMPTKLSVISAAAVVTRKDFPCAARGKVTG